MPRTHRTANRKKTTKGRTAQPVETAYVARHIKRKRRTHSELTALDDALFEIVAADHPMTVRQVFYQAEVRELVTKDESGYNLVQRRLREMRERGDLPYSYITDNMRIVRGYSRWNDLDGFTRDVASLYRRDYWANQPHRVEIWIEKDGLASTIFPVVVEEWGLDLHVARGFSSITYLQSAADDIVADGRPAYIYVLTDFDPSGLWVARKVSQELSRRADPVEAVVERLALDRDQVVKWGLPTRPNKKSDSRTKNFEREHGARSAELDAIPAHMLRMIVGDAIARHASSEAVASLKQIEEIERRQFLGVFERRGS